MKTPMKVNFEDTVKNWRRWGELVQCWIFDILPRPVNSAKLVTQMTEQGITGASIYGPPTREVKFHSYSNDGPFVIELPTRDMLQAGRKVVRPGQRYPLPIFYDGAYDGPRTVFTADDGMLFGACRMGEYIIDG